MRNSIFIDDEMALRHGRILLLPLLPLLWLYRCIIAARNFCYDHGIFKSTKLSTCVISVGNLSVGGTGKTPTTIFLAKTLRAHGWMVVILARGYRRQKKGLVVVSDGRQILADIAEAGDEPLLMAQACAGVPVVVDERKRIAAEAAVKKFLPDIILVDDGFQHRQLHRDLDVVLVDAHTPLSSLWWFPAAPLREPSSSLRRADFVILNTGGCSDWEQMVDTCRRYTAAKIFSGTLQGCGWRGLKSPSDMGQNAGDKWKTENDHLPLAPKLLFSDLQKEGRDPLLPLTLVKDQPVILVSGIAHPGRFRELVEKFGARVVGAMKFGDHYRYQKKDIEAVESARKASGARYILTTSKDAVKLAALVDRSMESFLILETAFEIEPQFLSAFVDTVHDKMLPPVN